MWLEVLSVADLRGVDRSFNVDITSAELSNNVMHFSLVECLTDLYICMHAAAGSKKTFYIMRKRGSKFRSAEDNFR